MAVIRSPFSRVPKPVDTSGPAEYYRKVLGRDISDILPSNVSAPDEDVQPAEMPVALPSASKPFDFSKLIDAPDVSAGGDRVSTAQTQRQTDWTSRQTGPEGLEGLVKLLPDRAERAVRQAGATFTEGLARAIATPGRVIQSFVDELVAEPMSGDLPDLFEFVTQVFDFENFNPEYRPIEDIGNLFDKEWGKSGFTSGVDTLLNLSAQIASDPITYTTLSPLKYQGTAGRAAAAQDFLGSRVAAGLDDAAKARYAADIQRYGEYALPTQVRSALVQEGVFAQGGIRVAGQVIPGTAEIAAPLSQRIGAARAGLGDRFSRAATVTMPGSTQMLAGVARGETLSSSQILSAFAAHSAAVNAKANAGALGARLAGEHESYVRSVAGLTDDQQRQLINHLEGVEEAFDPVVRQLADDYTTRSRMMLDESNALQREVSEAHGLRLEEVPTRENWFHRTFSQGWRNLSASPSRRSRDAVKRVAADLGVDVRTLRKRAGFTMSRKNMTTFLGEPLVYGGRSTVELNDIAERVVGVRIFEENVGKNLQSYMKDIVSKFQRESFINHLFRVAPTRIKPLLSTAPSARKVSKVIDQLEAGLRTINRELTGNTGSARVAGEQYLKDVLATAQEIVTPGFRNTRKARKAEKVLRERVAVLRQEVEELRAAADLSTSELLDEFESVVRPLQAKLDSLQAAIDRGEGEIAAAYEWLMRRHVELFPDVAVRPTSVNQLAAEVSDYATQNLSGAARSSALRAAETRRAAAVRRGATVDVDGETVGLSAAKAQAGAQRRAVSKAESEFRKKLAADPASRGLRVTENRLNREAAKLDAKAALAGAWERWVAEIGNPYLFDISQIRRLFDEMPSASDSYEMTAAWLRKVEGTMGNMLRAGYSEPELDALSRVMSQLLAGEADLATQQLSIAQARKLEQSVRKGLVDGDWVRDVESGWVGIESLNAQIPRELAEVLNNTDYGDLLGDFLAKVKDPNVRGYMGEMYDTLLAYFKNTAVLTIGFTVRNAMTGVFNNIVYATTPAQFRQGVTFAKNVTRYGLNRALDMAPQGQRARYQAAFDMVVATGGGRNVDEVIPVVGRQRGQFDNRVVQLGYNVGDMVFRPFAGRVGAGARRGNEAVELGIRLPLALNAVDQGFSLEAGAARIARVQFDYTDLSTADRFIKRFIPFWVFASRNIPLQLVNQALRPSAYLAYQRMRDAGGEYDPSLPRWRAQSGPLRIGEWYLDLDLPFQSVSSDIAGLTGLSGLLGQAAPFIRTPVEYVTGQRIAFGTAYPYSEQYRKAGVTDLPGMLLAIASGEGETLLEEGLIKGSRQDVAAGALPALANVQRYLAAIIEAAGIEGGQRVVGGPETYYERDPFGTLRKAVGLDLFKLTEEEKSKERARLQRELSELKREEARIKRASQG